MQLVRQKPTLKLHLQPSVSGFWALDKLPFPTKMLYLVMTRIYPREFYFQLCALLGQCFNATVHVISEYHQL